MEEQRSDDVDDRLPRVVGDDHRAYRLWERFERGGMGEVYKARDLRTHDRPVVVKFLHAVASRNPQDERRFRDEARQWAQLGDHPHIVSLFDSGEIDGRLFLEMEYVEGQDLADVLRTGPMNPARAVRLVAQVGSALDWAHRRDLIHRDVKPANILIHRPDLIERDDDLDALLADFGIARKAAVAENLTIENQPLGTMRYMAPERFDEQIRSDHRVDVYSLACVLYECLTGDPAWPQDGLPRLLHAIQYEERPRPSRHADGGSRHLEPFDQVIRSGLAAERDERCDSTRKFTAMAWEALDVWTATRADPSRGPLHVLRREPGGDPPEAERTGTVPAGARAYLTSWVNASGLAVGGGGLAAAATAYGGVGVGAVLIGAVGYVAGAVGANALVGGASGDRRPTRRSDGDDTPTQR